MPYTIGSLVWDQVPPLADRQERSLPPLAFLATLSLPEPGGGPQAPMFVCPLQGERDVRCYAPATNKTAAYPCMESHLAHTWRTGFNSSFVFVPVQVWNAVLCHPERCASAHPLLQLPGYIGDCDSTFADPHASYANCVPGVFNMRLAQVCACRFIVWGCSETDACISLNHLVGEGGHWRLPC